MSPLRGAERWLLLCVLGWAGNAQAELRLQPETGSLTPEQAAAAQQVLDSAVQRLPPAWVAALGSIPVAWRDDLPAQVHGRAKAKQLLLNRALLDDWMARPANAGIDEPAMRAALSAVLHELAHFYDRTPQGRLSQAPRLLDLAGWQVSPLRLGLRTRNDFSERSPDPYELSRASEFVAVNLEHFLLDPDYACRRPALYRYFSEHFDWQPVRADCAPGQVFLQADVDNHEPVLLQLDPSRVYAVDYLLAEANRQPMSRWGHSMLRLVICAPGRPPGPDCRLDLRYHRVLSFRAFVDDVQISNWRGLTGSYPSRLFLLPLEQVIDEYNKVELRGLQSIPLRLDRAEIAEVLERAAQVHWTYDGRYYFLSNNCAVETFKLLHDGVPRLAGEPLSSITPTGLLRRLKKAGVADGSVLDDPAEALRLGYRFESAGAYYQEMFDVARNGLGLPQQNVEQWLELAPAQRAKWLERGDLRASAALLLLEEASLRQQESLARDELKRRYLEQGAGGFEGEAALRDFLRAEGFLSRPAALLPNDGYGLPQAGERRALELEAERYAAQHRRQGAALRADAREWVSPERRSALEGTEANIASLGERLRRLHRAKGGLELQ